MGMPLGRSWNTQNHKFGHLDKDSIVTPIWMVPPPFVDYKNSELLPPNAWAWPYHGSWSEPCRISHHQKGAATVATWLENDALLSTCKCCQWLGLCSGHSLCSLLSHKLPVSVCNLHMTLLAYWGCSSLINLAFWKDTNMCNSFRGCSLAEDKGGNTSLQVELVLNCILLKFILRQRWLLGLSTLLGETDTVDSSYS